MRCIALLLVLLLTWTGLATIERHSVYELPFTAAQTGDETPSPAGSVDDHHLDDLPAQAQSELQTDPPGMPHRLGMPRLHFMSMERPDALHMAHASSPCLAGPLRPPCAASQAA